MSRLVYIKGFHKYYARRVECTITGHISPNPTFGRWPENRGASDRALGATLPPLPQFDLYFATLMTFHSDVLWIVVIA